MPTREQVLELVRAGCSYDEAASRLRIGAGLAYLIATGIPVDCSDGLSPEDCSREGLLPGSTQDLANPTVFNPTNSERVLSWARRRAHTELVPSAS